MHNKRMRIVVGPLAVYFVAQLSAYAQDEKTKVEGLITARTGDTNRYAIKYSSVQPGVWTALDTPICSSPRSNCAVRPKC
jgi:hypothetical protein